MLIFLGEGVLCGTEWVLEQQLTKGQLFSVCLPKWEEKWEKMEKKLERKRVIWYLPIGKMVLKGRRALDAAPIANTNKRRTYVQGPKNVQRYKNNPAFYNLTPRRKACALLCTELLMSCHCSPLAWKVFLFNLLRYDNFSISGLTINSWLGREVRVSSKKQFWTRFGYGVGENS